MAIERKRQEPTVRRVPPALSSLVQGRREQTCWIQSFALQQAGVERIGVSRLGGETENLEGEFGPLTGEGLE